MDWAYEVPVKFFVYTGTLLCVGVAGARLLAGSVADSRLDHALIRIARIAAFALLAAGLLRVAAHSVVAFGPSEGLSAENLRVIAIESRWGQAWQVQVLFATILAVTASILNPQRRAVWAAFGLSALAFCAAVPLLGHAAGSKWRLVFHAGHVVAVSAWLGTLTVLVGLEVRVPLSSTRFIPRFSPIALCCATVTVATGIVMTLTYVGDVSKIITTAYGRTLAIKLITFSGVLYCGRRNWKNVQLNKPSNRRWMAQEVALTIVVIALTSLLTELEHP
jgi:putative copper export protein